MHRSVKRLFAGAALGLSLTGMAAADDTLRSLADARGIHVGTAVSIDPFAYKPDADYIDVLGREYNMIVAENAFKWAGLHIGPHTYIFDDSDKLVDFAEKHGMVVRGHNLLWADYNPGWLNALNPTRDEAIAILKDHIQTVVGRYRGRVAEWDVVNEALDKYGQLRDSIWLKWIGKDYVALAFQFAHEADPAAKLYYNDYSAEDSGIKSNGVYKLVKDLQAQGVPIDGVGWQMHLTAGTNIDDSFRANGERLGKLGIAVEITELDVRVNLPVNDAELSQQAQTYADVVKLCLGLENCKAILTWGFTDKYSWVPGFFAGWGAALPFDEKFQPKPAYFAIRDALAQK